MDVLARIDMIAKHLLVIAIIVTIKSIWRMHTVSFSIDGTLIP
jgi:hypothetical protein